MEFQELAKDIFVVQDFISPEECQELIQFSETKGYEKATVNMGFEGQVVEETIRNNERVIYDSEEFASKMWEKVQAFVPEKTDYRIACGLNERFRFYKYHVRQQFRLHKDGSYLPSFDRWSYYTFMIYLNENIEGGETNFPNQDISVIPETGKALIFKHELPHEGSPVQAGIKYVIRTDIMYCKED